MIRECARGDIRAIYEIINEAAKAYKGFIPSDCYRDPYMPLKNLLAEYEEMTFYGLKEKGRLVGVMGYQPKQDVTLIRHAYVAPGQQRKGVGSKLLYYLKAKTSTRRILVGTWSAASWAIRFYEKNGFNLTEDKDALLKKYWHITEKQTRNSVVLEYVNHPP